VYVDSHAHLFYENYKSELPEVLRRAEDAAIDYIIVPGITRETSDEAVGLAEKYGCVYACVGYHPHEASKATERELVEIEELSKHKKVVAIGEIGLDYHYDFTPREKQKQIFNEQLALAVRRNLPVVIHTRNSLLDAVALVGECTVRNPAWKINGRERGRGVFHCFTGSALEAQKLFELGFFVSYPGIVTFKNSPVIEALKNLGLPRFLLETDSPYMAPVPLRGKRNEPANIVHIAKKVADVLGMSLDEVARVTTRNAIYLFGIHQS